MAAAAGLQHNYAEPFVVKAPAQQTATVIMLHGLGDTYRGWAPVGQQMSPGLPHVKWVFPTAPERPITCNGGARMPGWYDIADISSIDALEDEAGILDASRFVDGLVAKEIAAGTPANRIVVGGFSQGGAVALMSLRSGNRLAAVLGLSTYLPLRKAAETVASAEGKQTPVFMAHGEYDQVVKYAYGKASAELLQGAGCSVKFSTYPMQHSACQEEFDDLAVFLKQVIP